MARLLDLPNELLCRIASYVLPRSPLPFALTTRLLHALSKDALQKYELLAKDYRKLTFNDGCDEGRRTWPLPDTWYARNALDAILDNPDIRLLPRTLRVGEGWPPYFLWNRTLQVVDQELSDRLDSMTKRHGLPSWHDWHGSSQTDMLSIEEFAVELLCPLLPNLVAIEKHEPDFSFINLERIIHTIATANRDETSPRHRIALSRLRSFSCSTSIDDRQGMHLFSAFARLPSMRTLKGERLADDDFTWRHLRPLPPNGSNVTEIDVTWSAISPAAFEAVLGGIAALRKFTYHHHGAAWTPPFEPAGIVQALRQHAANTLEHVSLEACAQDDDYRDPPEEAAYIGSLRVFKSLKSALLHDDMFRQPDVEVEDEELPDGEFHRLDSEDESDPMDKLIDVLPRSIVSLKLKQTLKKGELKHLLSGLSERKAKELPYLGRLGLQKPDFLSKSMQGSLADADIIVCSLDESDFARNA
ncbi:MAG: hypothetical protein Q9174_005925 [Haloplaca sp. 1 TL-2023]